jgi:hypothetical protein
MARIYGRVEKIDDISRINCIIRDEMMLVETEAQLTELKKRSDYLCTLTYSPFWRKKFADQIEKVREVAIEENHITVKEANVIAKNKGWDVEYHPWGQGKFNVEDELAKIPQEVVTEVQENIYHIQDETDVLGELRKVFCDIRKAVLVCENKDCLDKIKNVVDILSALPQLESFAMHFGKKEMKLIADLVEVEKKRTVNLMNLVAHYLGIDEVYYEPVSIEDYDNADDYIKKLLEDEEKADTYIPTEVRWKGNAKVLWVSYYLPRRKRYYAKRIYFPADFKLVKVEGPGYFKNKLGREVYGIKITYESTIKPTTIHVRGKEIQLPERIVKRTKVVPIPKDAQNIQFTEEKPSYAMDIA